MTCTLTCGFETFLFIFVGEQSFLRCLWHFLPVSGMFSHSLDDIYSLLELRILTLTNWATELFSSSSHRPYLWCPCWIFPHYLCEVDRFAHYSPACDSVWLDGVPKEGLCPHVQLSQCHLLKELFHRIAFTSLQTWIHFCGCFWALWYVPLVRLSILWTPLLSLGL